MPTVRSLAPPPAHLRLAAVRRWLAGVARVARTVAGAPDYERYLAHHARRHPDAAPLPRDAFVEASLRARYERPGSRCC